MMIQWGGRDTQEGLDICMLLLLSLDGAQGLSVASCPLGNAAKILPLLRLPRGADRAPFRGPMSLASEHGEAPITEAKGPGPVSHSDQVPSVTQCARPGQARLTWTWRRSSREPLGRKP